MLRDSFLLRADATDPIVDDLDVLLVSFQMKVNQKLISCQLEANKQSIISRKSFSIGSQSVSRKCEFIELPVGSHHSACNT